ncbi:MAG: SMP-30/gluconolactonase/LRE family protein [Synergistaceae bacterium]|nr:SMP-30/gluconolactonase/LRE family protein [Synergistaceae bacterium]
MIGAELLFEAGDVVGEGPYWDSEKKILHWVDIGGKRVHSYDTVKKIDKPIETGDLTPAMTLTKSGRALVVLKNTIKIMDLDTGSGQTVFKMESLPDRVRFNDGKCDAAGRFWVGTMDIEETEKLGCLYRIDPGFSCKKILDGAVIANGMAWSADNRLMYFIDTPTREVWEFDFDITFGEISNKRIVAVIPDGEGAPDGMTIDSEGMLWVAQFRGAKVSRWNPRTRERIAEYPVPTYNITCCTFGGCDMDELFITSANVLMEGSTKDQQKLAGSLFKLKPGVKGLKPNRFDC